MHRHAMPQSHALALLLVGATLQGCSTRGVDGSAVFVGGNRPAVGITVTATTTTNIREEIDRSHKSARTDSHGHFSITGLLPDHTYLVSPDDIVVEGTPLSATVPTKGTVMLPAPIAVCPVPPHAGVWYYADPAAPPTEVVLREKVPFRAENVIFNAFGDSRRGGTPAFSVSLEDADRVSARIGRTGLLVITDPRVSEFAMLHRIPEHTFHLTTYEGDGRYSSHDKAIRGGWYYNIQDFRIDDFMVVGNKVLNAVEGKLDLSRIYRSQRGTLAAIPTADLAPGLYVVDMITADRRYAAFLGGDVEPREGYLVRIE
jgi:hypothetical protein